MRATVKFAFGLLSVAALAAFPGCILAAAAAVGGTAAYVSGDLEDRVEATPERVVQAAERSLKKRDVTVVSSDATGIDGKVIARTALDKKIEITVKRDGETASRIAIRVDTFGDEDLSRQVLAGIREEL
jgi:hypothetical protein